jgi:dTDP-glucose 4,6-dehydratase
VLKNEDIVIKGDGSTMRSYMYASDLMVWLWNILINGKCNEPYNVGSDESISISELAKLISKFDSNIKVMILNEIIGGSNYTPEIRHANKMGLKINVNLELSISKTIDFYDK